MLWRLWMTSKTLSKRPSDFLGVEKWASEKLGNPDWFTALQFDNALAYFGIYIENKLHETDKQGNALYTLDELLNEQAKTSRQTVSQLARMFGRLTKDKAGNPMVVYH